MGYHLLLTTSCLCSGCTEVPRLSDKGVFAHVFLWFRATSHFSLPWPTPVPPLGFSSELSAQNSSNVPLSLCFHSSKLLADYPASEFASVILFPHWVVTSLVTGTVSCPSLYFQGPEKYTWGWIFVALSKSHLCSRYQLITHFFWLSTKWKDMAAWKSQKSR